MFRERGNGGQCFGKEKKTILSHRIIIENRQTGMVTGVRDVYSFHEGEILLDTEGGKLSVKGEMLHVKRLNLEKGEADIEGRSAVFPTCQKIQTKKKNLC